MATVLLICSGCASYSQSFQTVEIKLLNNDPAGALEALDKQSHSNKDLFLYASNKATILRMLNKYSESNAEIEKAKAIIEKYSALSISETASSFIINDASQTYIGSPVEQIMLNIYAALNYLEMKDLDAARVEILQINIRLRTLMQDDPDSPLSIDPFAHYMSGIIYEDLGEWSDAMIAYRKAYHAYQRHSSLYSIAVPQQLKRVLILMADKIGLDEERRKYEQEFLLQLTDLQVQSQNQAELVFLFHNGLAPIKQESSINVLEPSSGHMIRISLPRYVNRGTTIAKARLSIQRPGSKQQNISLSIETEKTEDIGMLEIESLKAQMGVITARAIARAVAKHEASNEAGKQNDLIGLIVNIAGVLTERADTRSWLTLPAEIQMARLNAPADTYNVIIEFIDHNNHTLFQRSLGKIKLNNERKQYLSTHWASVSVIPNGTPVESKERH
ncbi:hypothetical protein MNBD_GAMMA25-229 [hydrothermal vent metagenome]|uniref:Uncharacterized protein n=1 Tax=hydrothermal vent metagenome TaxID=652676 RepID=A0A3B1BF62_9ZZZZ